MVSRTILSRVRLPVPSLEQIYYFNILTYFSSYVYTLEKNNKYIFTQNIFMNQILFNKSSNYISRIKKFKFFRVSLFLLILISLLSIIVFVYFRNIMHKKELVSKELTSKYSISLLYSQNSEFTTSENASNYYSLIIGLVEIPKIKLVYPILSNTTDDLLRFSPCRFSGPLPNENGNLCIAGHNYGNYAFFSKLNLLNNGDIINISDLKGNKLTYEVFSKYEVDESDTTPLAETKGVKKEVTLITCNNANKMRIIVKAKNKT